MDSSNSIDYLEKKLEKLEFHFIKTFASLHQSTEVICADHLFNVFREFLENLDNLLRRASRKISLECNRDIQKLLFVLSSLFPYGDYRLIRLLLDLLQKFRSNESQEIIVDNLPRIFTAAFQGRCRSINESEKILIDMAMNMVASTLNRLDHLPLLIAPVIECLSLLPHSDEGKERFLDIIQSSLPDTPQQDFPRCVRVMLNNISEAEDASSVVTILRQELIRRQASDSSGYVCQTTMFEVLEVVIFALIPSMKYPMWAAPYFKIIEKQRLDTDIAFLPCDLAVFVILSQENQFASVSEEVVHSWLLSGKFPFDTLSNLVDLISRRKPGDSSLLSSPLVYERLAAPLIRLSLLLLISRVKVKCYVNTAKKVDDFILYFYRQLIYSHQRELIKELLQLSEESITFFSGLKCNVNNSQRKKLKLKPPNVLSFSDSRRIIHQSVNALLRKLADKYPETLVQFKMDFVRLLQSPIDNSNIEMNNITSNEQSAGDLCHILLRIFDSDQTNIYPGCIHFAKAELLLLIQNMLFSPCETSKTVFTSTNEQSSIRGIMIATALVRSNELSATENISVRDWILQTILPNTRQMVRPGVGCLCLRFLKIWKDLEIDSGNIFHYLQNILSNTGLIQKNIIHCPDSIIAFNYSNTNVVIESAEKIDSCGDFMFCINFFLRHNQLGNPEEWMTAVNWVFDLVDTYLRIGRQRSKNWKPNRWLKASIEFPALSTGTWANGSSNVISAIHWLKLNLCQFDCYDSHQQIDGINKIVETLSTLDFKLFGKVRVSLFQFRLSLLLGSSVSAAVLRNAYGHSNTNSTKTDHSCHSHSSNDSFELIKLQLTKIYNLQAKSLLMDDLLSSLATNLCQQKSKIYCESRRDDPKKHSSPSVLEGKVTKEISLEVR